MATLLESIYHTESSLLLTLIAFKLSSFGFSSSSSRSAVASLNDGGDVVSTVYDVRDSQSRKGGAQTGS